MSKDDEETKLKKILSLKDLDELSLRSMASFLGPPASETPKSIIIRHAEKEGLPRTITVYGFSLGTGQDFIERIHKFYLEDPDSPVLILILSYGGQVDGLFAMVGAMKAYPMEFRTCVAGTAMSCGAVLLSAGNKGKRYALPHSRIMIHKVSNFLWGNVDDIKNEAEETDRINEELLSILAENTKYDLATWKKTLTGEDGAREFYIPAIEALKIGLVDEIVSDLPSIIPVAPITGEEPEESQPETAPATTPEIEEE